MESRRHEARFPHDVPRRRAAAVALTALVCGAMLAPLSLGTGCLSSSINVIVGGDGGEGEGGPAATVEGDDPSQNEASKDAIEYRDLGSHPGCSTAGLSARAASGCQARPVPASGVAYEPAQIPGFKCAAKAYTGGTEDPSKPIVILVHGNSDTPTGWEAYPAADSAPQLAESLVSAGFKVFAADFRYDLVDDPKANLDTENAALNFDHGWATPIAQNLFESVMAAYPDRPISIVGFSLGPTIIRDALRRLHRENKKPFEHIKDLVLAAGAHHGVSSYRKLCGDDPDKPTNPTMRGRVACQLGDLTSYKPTKFLTALNGPNGDFETPCLDGDVAFGQRGVCGGHKVRYTTVVMKDNDDGTLADEFVSQTSSALKGANNLTVPVGSNDATGYFCGETAGQPTGLLKNHYGAVRSAAGLKVIVDALSAP